MDKNRHLITVLHLCEHFGGRESSLHGPARAFQWWIPAFDPQRFRVLLCSRKGYDKAAQQMIDAGVPPLYLGYGKTDPRNLIALIRLVRREKVDIIHAHGYGACTWGRLAGLLLGIPVIVHERCNYSTVPFPQRLVEWLLAPLTHYAFAVSESTRRFTIEKRYIKAGAVTTLYNGILLDRLPKADPGWVKETRAALGATGNQLVIGMVGRLEAQKGHADALLAFQAVAREFPAARLWIVGDGTLESEIRSRIDALGLKESVLMLGYRADARQLMQCFDVMLFASHHEGTPNTLYEALALGRTCVASMADGLGEILEEGKTALLFAPGDVDAMARQLKRVLANELLRKSLAEQALLRAQDFDGMRCVRTMEATYDTIMKKKVLFMNSQPFFQWRGSPIRVGFDVLALAQLGYDVDFLTLPLGERKPVEGVNIIRVPNLFLARNIAIGPSFLKACFDVLILFKGLALMLRRKYAVIHCVEDTGPIGVLLAALTGADLVFEKHSDPVSYNKGAIRNAIMWLYSKVEAFSARRADAVICTGPGLVRQVQQLRTGKPVYHIFDIPSSLVQADPARTAAARGKLVRVPDEVVVTYVGSFAVYQGVDLLFEAMPHVVAQCPNARFVVIGGSPAEVEARTGWLRQRGIEANVTWTGKIPPDELADYLAASDILLSPRLSGVNTPLKVLDYLKAGKAIVATDTESNRLLLDQDTAVMVAADPESFAAGIIALIRDPGLRARMGEGGAKLIRETYNFAEFRRLLGQCYAALGVK